MSNLGVARVSRVAKPTAQNLRRGMGFQPVSEQGKKTD